MVKTFTWDVQIAAQTVIAELNPPPQSVYSSIDPTTSQPWLPGQTNANVASLSIKNVGTKAGKLSWRCYAHANQTGEILLTEGTTTNNYSPGTSVQQPQIVTIPNEPGITIPFGVKVKGETETTWPTWGLGLQNGQAYIFGGELKISNNAIILGVIGAAGIIGILWYTKKKHMW
jgi:hypothetical protein